MRAVFVVTLGTLLFQQLPAQQAEHATPSPRVRATARTASIVVDGVLSEADWSSAAAAKDFRQQDPREGDPASQPTEIRFVYDVDALYIGARMFDTMGRQGVRSRLGRRDQLGGGDYIDIILDTFHDHTGRTIFTVSPSGARGDAGQSAPFADPSWDPIWEVATRIDSLGWTAELRIPFSQLRFPNGSQQIWGLQVWRFVERLNEVQMWSYWGKQENGGPPRFGHLEGLTLEPRKFGVEVLPYLATRAEDITLADPDTPLRDPREYDFRAGADIKALLTSTITLDATFNPDFGQVEVDPAVVNLSAFETSFEEKRPFFVEGSGLFGFGGLSCYFCSNVSSLSLFYSRRIGRRPQGAVGGSPRFVETPENSTILGAAKVTGRTAGGYQIGLLNAVTSSEQARAISEDGDGFEQEVEPLTNYFVGRVKRNLAGGNIRFGAIGTSVVRRFQNDGLRSVMPSHSEAAGVDFDVTWADRTYNLMGNVALTQVTGDSTAMLRFQESSARYFNRPDREHGSNGVLSDRYDGSLTQMRGAGGYVRLAKVAGSWLWEGSVNARSPGFEANDMAFLTRADYLWMNANIVRQWLRPTRVYRNLNTTLGVQQQYNFDGDVNDQQVHWGAWMQLANYWSLNTFTLVRPGVIDDRLTRGGAAVEKAAGWYSYLELGTDSRKKVALTVGGNYSRNEEGATGFGIDLNARLKPTSSLTMSIGPSYNRGGSGAQYVNRFEDPAATHFYGDRVVFSDLVQHSLSLDTRVSATFTPTLTLELFAQPFVSTGDYSNFKEFIEPRKLAKRPFDAQQLREVREDGRVTAYELDPDRSPITDNFEFDNPDFNFRSLRGNAVLRWEYRPGSTLFLVWQQQRDNSQPFGDFDASRDATGMFEGRPDNIFLVKMTYWLGR